MSKNRRHGPGAYPKFTLLKFCFPAAWLSKNVYCRLSLAGVETVESGFSRQAGRDARRFEEAGF